MIFFIMKNMIKNILTLNKLLRKKNILKVVTELILLIEYIIKLKKILIIMILIKIFLILLCRIKKES